MLYTNQGGTSTAGIKTHSLSLSERLAAALEKRTQSRGATFNGLLDDESDDIFMSSSSSSESSSDSEDESVDSDDVTVTSGAKGKSDSDVNKFLEGIDPSCYLSSTEQKVILKSHCLFHLIFL